MNDLACPVMGTIFLVMFISELTLIALVRLVEFCVLRHCYLCRCDSTSCAAGGTGT